MLIALASCASGGDDVEVWVARYDGDGYVVESLDGLLLHREPAFDGPMILDAFDGQVMLGSATESWLFGENGPRALGVACGRFDASGLMLGLGWVRGEPWVIPSDETVPFADWGAWPLDVSPDYICPVEPIGDGVVILPRIVFEPHFEARLEVASDDEPQRIVHDDPDCTEYLPDVADDGVSLLFARQCVDAERGEISRSEVVFAPSIGGPERVVFSDDEFAFGGIRWIDSERILVIRMVQTDPVAGDLLVVELATGESRRIASDVVSAVPVLNRN